MSGHGRLGHLECVTGLQKVIPLATKHHVKTAWGKDFSVTMKDGRTYEDTVK